jgi:hypothetical protein
MQSKPSNALKRPEHTVQCNYRGQRHQRPAFDTQYPLPDHVKARRRRDDRAKADQIGDAEYWQHGGMSLAAAGPAVHTG